MTSSLTTRSYLKIGIWAYFLLLIFEGALRKWVFPSLATPLLVVRDPVAIWLIYISWREGLLKFNIYMAAITVMVMITTVTTLLLGHGNIPVTIYGVRILLIHFPLIFVIGEVFNRDDVVKLGRVMLYITIPMAVLIAWQFYSPQSAWVNRGVGGTEGGGFDGAMGFFRPPATFSFTNGTALFFGFSAVFIVYFWLSDARINKLILMGATAGLLLAIPLSISRSLLFLTGLTVLFAFAAIANNPKYVKTMLLAGAIIAVVLVILGTLPIFQTAAEAFTTRFTNASETEGGLEGVFMDRFLGGMISALIQSGGLPFFGYGLGMGTGVGSQLIAGDHGIYLVAEGEWGRLIGEMGVLCGLVVILARTGLCISMMKRSYRAISRQEILPWLLCGIGSLGIIQGQWSQPTTLGFHVIMGGLILAALNRPPAQTILVRRPQPSQQERSQQTINTIEI